jgi:hypothetical protein
MKREEEVVHWIAMIIPSKNITNKHSLDFMFTHSWWYQHFLRGFSY